MKRFLLYLFFMMIPSVSFAQDKDCPTCPGNNADHTEYDVIKTKDIIYEGEFVPGQILIKLKDDVKVSLAKVNGVTVMGVSSIDAILQKHNMQKAEKLFPNEKRSFNKRMLKTSNGKEFEQPNLHNIYKVEGDSTLNIFEVINELKEDPNVEYAEPNYILSIVDCKPVSPALTESEMIEWIKEHPEINVTNSSALLMTNDQLQKPNAVTPNDPLYPQQWGIPATQVDAVWDSTTGDTTQLIAILDTGVDWLHPDLKNKIWTNPNEIPDNGMDDDGNGYVDDVRGWDWINNDNNPTDDNSHGTHVAGIAAAESNNGIGIAGVNWKAKILPLKVFQSSGRGDAATITQSIIYAKNKGATVINMSFGSYTRSLTMESALQNAYATCILVAAAGNDGQSIGKLFDYRFYPAALSYVLGVEATQKERSFCGYRPCWSNFDYDGPIFSKFHELSNYELKSPGDYIISTIPQGNYKIYNGTSMSTPLVSGAVALYKELNTLNSSELMWGNLINTTQEHLKIFDAINIKAKSQLWFVSNTIVDTLLGDDEDGSVDAGETIELWFMVRNTWKQSDSVFVGIKFGEFEDTTTARILKDIAFVGSISPYAMRSNERDPIIIHINSNVSHDRDIVFEAKLWHQGTTDTIRQQIIMHVEKVEQLSGIIDGNKELFSDKVYKISGNVFINENIVLKINPGTQIILGKDRTITCLGQIQAIGTFDSLISFTGENYINTNDWSINIYNPDSFNYPASIFKYCKFEGSHGQFSIINTPGHGIDLTISDCIFKNHIGRSITTLQDGVKILRSNIQNMIIYNYTFWITNQANNYLAYNNIVNNLQRSEFIPGMYASAGIMIGSYEGSTNINIIKNNIFNNYHIDFRPNNLVAIANSQFSVVKLPPNYFGSQDSQKVDFGIIDYFDYSGYLPISFSNYLVQPTDSAHGIVWKVLVNGKDAQDEIVDPVGVGPQRYDVYFNRPMDTTYVPQLTFGVREPFTQQAVVDSSKWSVDRKIWTAYKTIKLYTGDGINRLRVEGARDDEGFEIPVEDQRFEFLISAAGSSSLDFAATAGLGKVNLEWSNPQDVPDLLGYNMYRLEHINDSTLTQPVMINTSLINDTLFTDFNVIPNKKYYYYYRTVRTDFSESDSSRVVSTTPYTAALGDGNGDLAVNVLDVLGTVSYILGQNPQPFIFDAADVVRDSIINVLDVVGNVNIILKGTLLKNYLAKTSYGNAKVEFTGNEIYLTTDQPVAGIQLQFKGKGLKDKKFIYSGSSNFENMSSSLGDTMQIALMYSLHKNEFAPGKYLIGSIEGDPKGISLSDAVLSDNEGGKINLNLIDNGVSTIPDDYYLDQNYPNPFNLSTTIQYGIPAKTAGKIVIYNILGQQVRTFDLGEREAGRYKIMWDGKNNYGSVISTGVYIFRFESVKFTSAKKMILLK